MHHPWHVKLGFPSYNIWSIVVVTSSISILKRKKIKRNNKENKIHPISQASCGTVPHNLPIINYDKHFTKSN